MSSTRFDEGEEGITTAAHRYCPWCGVDVVEGRPFCPACGKPISSGPRGSVWQRLPGPVKKVGIVLLVIGIVAFYVGQAKLSAWDENFRKNATVTAVASEDACLDYGAWSDLHNARVARLLALWAETPTAANEGAHDQEVVDTLRDIIEEMEAETSPPIVSTFSGLVLEQFRYELQVSEELQKSDVDHDKVLTLIGKADNLNLPVEDAKRDLIKQCGS